MSTVYGYLNERTRSISQSSKTIRRRTNGVSLLVEGQNGSLMLPGKSTTADSVVESMSRRHCSREDESGKE